MHRAHPLVVALLALANFVLVGFGAACSSGGATQDAGPECAYPMVHNEGGCPATYSTARLPPTCAPVGLTCDYPGAGDGTSSGCASTAVLWCVAGPGDAGPHWSGAQ